MIDVVVGHDTSVSQGTRQIAMADHAGLTSREWLANCGRRRTRNSIVHLLLEFANRFKSLNLKDVWKFRLPMPQAEIADAVGSSLVQVNRITLSLRAEHMIRSYGTTIVIEEYGTLARGADFTPWH
ncbi:MAG: helix-turn-helix domain-containing protein [Novosphingobium sp.]